MNTKLRQLEKDLELIKESLNSQQQEIAYNKYRDYAYDGFRPDVSIRDFDSFYSNYCYEEVCFDDRL